jgi:transcription elongation GreA/GreB family factor
MSLKETIHLHCLEQVRDRISNIETAIKDAQEAANEETKSSVGDKHETGRSMMQLETEKLHAQLELALRDQQKLSQISPNTRCQVVSDGALVITNNMNLYFSISSGRMTVEGKEYVSLSIQSPLGEAARGLKSGDSFQFRGRGYEILGIS